MLTSFFKGYKAEQFVVLFLLLISVFVLYGFENQIYLNDWIFFLKPLIGLIVFSALILVFWFIVQKNKLLPTGGIKYLIFVSLSCFFPNIICDYKLMTIALISTLILRKTLSLSSKKDIIKKLVDASLLLLAASYIETWSLILIIFLYVSLLIYELLNFRYYIIPLYVFLLVSFSFYALQKILNIDLLNELEVTFNFPNLIEFSNFHKGLIIIVTLFLIGFIVVLFKFFKDFSNKKRQHTYVLLIYFFVGVFQAVLSIEKGVLNYILLLVPLTYLICVLLLRIKNKKVLELILWLFMSTPIIYHSVKLIVD